MDQSDLRTRPIQQPRLGNWDEALYGQQRNKYVLRGYRTGKAEALTSLKFLHNETGNIYMHLWSSNLYPGVAKTLSFRKPFGTRSTITFHTSLYNTHGLHGMLYSATALQHKFYSLIVCRERQSWRGETA